MTGDGRVKVADFGIAKAVDQMTAVHSFRTATGQTIGTPTYMAPEQAMAQELGPWTDLYSIGVMAYELFAGRPPFTVAGQPMALLMKHVTEQPPPLADARSDLDPRIVAWVERLLAKEPGDRPADAESAWIAFEEIVLDTLGARWRRSARLLDPAAAATRPPLTPAPGHEEPAPEPEPASEPEPPTRRLAPATGGRQRPHTGPHTPAPPTELPPPEPPPPTRPRLPPPPEPPTRRPRRAGALLLVLAAVAAVVLVTVLLLGGGDDGGGEPRSFRDGVLAAMRPLLRANQEMKVRARALRPGDDPGGVLESATAAQEAAEQARTDLRDLSPATARERGIRRDALAAVTSVEAYVALAQRMLRRQASSAEIAQIGERSDDAQDALKLLHPLLPGAEGTVRGATQLKAWALNRGGNGGSDPPTGGDPGTDEPDHTPTPTHTASPTTTPTPTPTATPTATATP